MASEDIGSLVVRIEAKMDQFAQSANKVEGLFSKITKAAVGFGAVLGAGAIFKSFISEASEAQENISQLDNVLKSTGGAAGVTRETVLGLADSLSSVTKFSDDAVLAGQNLLLTFTGIGKDTFPGATQAMLDMSQALGQDMKSSAIQLGKALNDPIQGVTALKRVGVSFTESQMEVIKSLVQTGDVVGAQKLILEELNKEFGGSAEAAGKTFPGQLAILGNSLNNVKESIGMQLMPTLQSMVTKIQEHMPQIQAFVDNAITKMGNAIKFVIDNSNVLIPALGGVLAAVLALKIIEGITSLMKIWTVITKGLTLAQTLLNAVMLGNPFAIVALAIAGLIAGGVLLWRNWDSIKAKAEEVFGKIRDFVQPVLESIADSFKSMVNGVITALNFLIRGLNRINFKVPDWVPGLGGKGFGFNMSELPQLAQGTNFVPFDTMAFLHKGEAVIPAANNPANSGTPAVPNIDYDRLGAAVAKALSQSPIEVNSYIDGQRAAKALWSPLVGEKQRLGVATL